jgi:uracil-DNA glycosylase
MGHQNKVLTRIKKCQGCPLYNNQTPLLDNNTDAEIFWVGLSAVKVESTKNSKPLANTTNSGKLIQEIEHKNKEVGFYKTNLVKCLPLEGGKIRYPNKGEMRACCKHLDSEITAFKPKLVFLLGKQVADFVTENKESKYSEGFKYETYKRENTIYVPVHHPSYILVYKRKQIEHYINGITQVINQFLKNPQAIA